MFAEEFDDDAVGEYPALQEHDDVIVVVDGLPQLQQQSAARDAVHEWQQRPAAASRRGDPSSGRRKRRCWSATLVTSGASHVAFIFLHGTASASATGRRSQQFADFFISPR